MAVSSLYLIIELAKICMMADDILFVDHVHLVFTLKGVSSFPLSFYSLYSVKWGGGGASE